MNRIPTLAPVVAWDKNKETQLKNTSLPTYPEWDTTLTRPPIHPSNKKTKKNLPKRNTKGGETNKQKRPAVNLKSKKRRGERAHPLVFPNNKFFTSITFLTWTAFFVGTRKAVSSAPTHGGAMEIGCTWVRNLPRRTMHHSRPWVKALQWRADGTLMGQTEPGYFG